MNEKELLNLKEEIEEAEKKASKLEGQEEHIRNQLKSQYGVSTIPSAEKKLERLEKNLQSKKKELEEAMSEVEEKFDGR